MMRQTFVEFRMLSRVAYACLFGALFGYTAFGYTLNGLLYVWIVLALVGGIFVVIKNSKITNSSLRVKIAFSDFFVTLFLLALIYLLPSSLGLVKAVIVLVVESVYVILYVKIIYKTNLLR